MNEPRLELSTVRGVACVALVAYHVIGPTSDSGMHLEDASYWHLAMNSLDFLRMPMFSVLSGYLYAGRRADAHGLIGLFQHKAARLLVPLLFVTTITFVLRQIVYDEQTSYATALLFHYQHLWFLQALILIFLGIGLWDAFSRPSWVGLCIAGFAAIMVSRTFSVTSFLSLDGALYLLPYFALGMIFRIEPTILRSRELIILASALVAIVMLTRQASAAFGGNEISRLSLPAALCGAAGAYLMLTLCPRARIFESVGRYSYTVFLWHSIAASAVRQGLATLIQLPVAAEFAFLVLIGVTAPIALHLTVQRIPVLSLLAAGIGPKERSKLGAVNLRIGRRRAAVAASCSTSLD